MLTEGESVPTGSEYVAPGGQSITPEKEFIDHNVDRVLLCHSVNSVSDRGLRESNVSRSVSDERASQIPPHGARIAPQGTYISPHGTRAAPQRA